MIDHLMAFATEASAKVDPVVGAYCKSGWDMSQCLPGLFVWAPALNTLTTDDNGNQITTRHAFDSMWRVNVALPTKNAALCALSSCHLVTDRDAANAGLPFVLQSVLTDAQLAALMIEPLFAGSNYPFGSPQ